MKKTITWKRTTALATCALMLAATAAGGLATMDHGSAAAAESYTVDVSKGLQEFDGWGLSLSWWATEIGDWTRIGSSGKEKREEIAEALYGPTGLNLNIARYNIGGGDDPTHTHMSDDRNTPGWRNATKSVKQDSAGHDYTETVLDDYVWVGEDGETIPWTELKDLDTRNDYRQLWVLDWIQNEHGVNGQNDYISEFYSNSPPWWMTMTGCSSGGVGAGQNLDYAYNQDFVDYFLDVYEYLTSQGFEFGNLQPFNESGSNFWGVNGDQEGCYFSPDQKVQVLDLLRKEMEERGLDVPYNWGDETNTNVAYDQYNQAIRANPEIVRGADRYTYHIYWYDVSTAQRMYRTAKRDGKDIYMSEICFTDTADNGQAEYDPESVRTGFDYTQSIIDTVKHGGVDGYVFWQGMEDMVGQMKSHTNYGLIQGVYYTQEEAEKQGVDLASMGLTYQDYVLSKAYYMSGQYTKYIRPGYRLVDVNEDNTIAAVSPDGETLVIVKQNNSGDKVDIRFDLDGFNAQSIEKIVTDKNNSWAQSRVSVNGNYVSDKLSDYSVTTYVIHGKKTVGDSKFVDESAFQSKADLAAIKDAFAEVDGEGNPIEPTEQYYQTGFSDNGGDGKYYGQTSYSQNGCFAYRFYGTGTALSFLSKSDSGAVDIYIDSDPTAEGVAATAHVDVYSETKTPGKIVYRNNTLEEGWHTVYVKAVAGAHGSWVNLDGVFLYTSADAKASEQSLFITSAAGQSGTIAFEYEAEGYDGYTIYAEYTENGEWTRTEALDAAETNGTITGVEGSNITLRLVAVKGEEAIYSPECIVKMQKTEEGVLYYVDCATSDPAGAMLGELQSVADQPYAADLVSGKEWGYTGTYTQYFGDDEAMSSIWSLDKTEDPSIVYKFTIPEAGTYKVALGFYGGEDGWGERSVYATVKGIKKEATIRENAYTALFFEPTTTAANEVLTVKVERKTADQNSSHLSLIAITKSDVQLPLYIDGAASEYNTKAIATEDIIIGEDIYEKLQNKSFTLYYTDGTSKALTYEEADVSVAMSTLTVNQNATAVFTYEDGISCTFTYRWTQEGGTQLYYNIDCGFTGTGTPPDDADELGTKQSTTHDREYGPDAKAGTEWGYVGTNYNNGVNWGDNSYNKWSIREGKDGTLRNRGGDQTGGELTYKMTGFKPNELLSIETGGHCHNWGARSYGIYLNGSDDPVGIVNLRGGDGVFDFTKLEGENIKADENGELTVKCSVAPYEGAYDFPQVAYIKVWSVDEPLQPAATITADKTEVESGDTVTLNGLDTQGTVYVYDDLGYLVDSFRPTAASQQVEVTKYINAGATELHFSQASEKASPSSDLILRLKQGAAAANIEYIVEGGYVAEGDAVVIRFVPHTEQGVTSLTLKTPDGVNYNLMDSFFYRATKNGTYTVTLVSGGSSVSETFTIDTIDALTLGESFSATGWTADSVTVTLAPEANSGIASVSIDGAPATAQEGKYTFTASENGVHTVKVVTAAGFEYEREVTVANIDKAAPELALNVQLTANGVSVGYEATAASGGKVTVAFNGTESAATENNILLNAAGKYEIWFTNGAGVSTAKTTYYVTYGLENAQLATVTADEEGLLTVAAKNGTATSALYRAGEETSVTSMKAEKVGKYYLDITSGSDREIVVLYVQSAEAGGGIGDSNVGGGEESGCGGVIAAPAAAIGAIVIVCVAAAVIFVKRRKNS